MNCPSSVKRNLNYEKKGYILNSDEKGLNVEKKNLNVEKKKEF